MIRQDIEMFNVRVTRKTRNLEKLVEKLEALSKENVETGVFAEQGEHPTAEMSYVELAVMHEQGNGNFPPRTVRPLIMNSMKNKPFMDKVSENINKYLFRDVSLNYALGYIGQDMAMMGKSFFGVPNSPDMPSNSDNTIEYFKGGQDTPLVDQGFFKDTWAYKTSVNNIVVESV